ncbi:MAG: CHAD domain-containing protein [Candidatus Binataceae bacterium]
MKLGRHQDRVTRDPGSYLFRVDQVLRRHNTAEFFRSLYQKKREKAYFHALAQLQNSLGQMNDIVVADHLLERLSAAHEDQRISAHLSTAVGVVTGWHTHSAGPSKSRL